MVRKLEIQENILAGQRALVTGASSGIGRAIALSLAEAGARVAVNYLLGDDNAEEVVEEIKKKGGEAIAVKADVGKEDEVKSMFRRMNDAYGSIDILVNNAGLQKDAPVHKMSLDDWNGLAPCYSSCPTAQPWWPSRYGQRIKLNPAEATLTGLNRKQTQSKTGLRQNYAGYPQVG